MKKNAQDEHHQKKSLEQNSCENLTGCYGNKGYWTFHHFGDFHKNLR